MVVYDELGKVWKEVAKGYAVLAFGPRIKPRTSQTWSRSGTSSFTIQLFSSQHLTVRSKWNLVLWELPLWKWIPPHIQMLVGEVKRF